MGMDFQKMDRETKIGILVALSLVLFGGGVGVGWWLATPAVKPAATVAKTSTASDSTAPQSAATAPQAPVAQAAQPTPANNNFASNMSPNFNPNADWQTQQAQAAEMMRQQMQQMQNMQFDPQTQTMTFTGPNGPVQVPTPFGGGPGGFGGGFGRGGFGRQGMGGFGGNNAGGGNFNGQGAGATPANNNGATNTAPPATGAAAGAQ